MSITAPFFFDNLVERCKEGDARSCAELYRQYAKAMYNTSLRIVNNVADAEDVLQESFAEAFRHINDFNYTSTFGAWLKRIIINRSLNLLRKQKGKMLCIDEVNITHVEYETIDEEAIQLKVEEVQKAVKLLPAGYRAILTLHLFEGYDYEEIAEVMNITTTTARTQYHRAKLKLLCILKKEVCCEK